jgi:hypothetical protein
MRGKKSKDGVVKAQVLELSTTGLLESSSPLKAFSQNGQFKEITPQRMYHASGQLVDQATKSNYEARRQQLSFSDLGIAEAEEGELKLELGIHLPAGADALKNTLERVLFDSRSKRGLGNYAPTTSLLFGESEPAPRLFTSYLELAREHHGKTNPSGRDISEVRKNLLLLSEKSHVFVVKSDKGTIVDYAKLIVSIVEGYKGGLSEDEERDLLSEDKNLSSKRIKSGQLLITLNPIFQKDIDQKFIPKPSDLNERIRDASGAKNPSEAIRLLSEYLHRQLTNKVTKSRGAHEIGERKLISTLRLDKYVEQGRRGLLEKRLEEALKACSHKRLPLLLGVEKGWDRYGDPKYIFTLNLNYPNLEESSLPLLEAAES